MPLEITPPSTASQAQVLFSNDAATKFEVVSPGNPLPVTGTFTPGGTQDVNLKQVGGVATDIGTGAAGTGTQRVAVSSDSSIIANAPVSTTFTPTQVTVPATANGILIIASNSNRKGATISNPGPLTVYVQQGSTGVTTSTGFGILAGTSYNIDSPTYTGALYGIISSGTQVVTVTELT